MHSWKQLALLVVAIVGGLGVAAGAQAKKAAKPRVFFIEPKNGAQVSSPVHMKFGAEGIEIAAVRRCDSDRRPDGFSSHRRWRQLPASRQDHRQGHPLLGALRRRQVGD